MKKLLLAFAAFIALQANAQIGNNDFETWNNDTLIFPGFAPVVLPDTFEHLEPAGWTSSNILSGAAGLGNKFFVSQTASSHSGSFAVHMITDTLQVPSLGTRTLPGFVVSGKFAVNSSILLGSGTVLTPSAIGGAGTPINKRLSKITGYRNYQPVFNPNTNGNDTCLIWATLRKGTTVVADAIYKSTTQTTGYQYFEAPFVYYTCDMPDTLVILMAPSLPNLSALVTGNSNLVPGSTLEVDSLGTEDLPGNYNFTPFARNDFDTTNINTAKDVMIETNDEDCNDALNTLTIAVSSNAAHGTAVAGTGKITYTPNNGYVGVDTFYYTLNDGVNTSTPAFVRMLVKNPNDINEVAQVPVTVFPVPASNTLNVLFDYAEGATVKVYDLVGNIVMSSSVVSNNTQLNIANLPNGMYGVQLVNKQNEVIARTKFTVSK